MAKICQESPNLFQLVKRILSLVPDLKQSLFIMYFLSGDISLIFFI